MEIHSFAFNPIQENTYIISDETGNCAIVDAGCCSLSEFSKLNNYIINNGLTPVKLINTHCHFDHILGVEKCREAYNLKWEAHPDELTLVERAKTQAAMFGIQLNNIALPDILLNDGDEIVFGNTCIKVLHVPGHSPGSICLYIEESNVLITGDVLFYGSIGRTDLPGGDYQTLISGIKTKLLSLPNNVLVYPGHGPATSIGNEKSNNPFLM